MPTRRFPCVAPVFLFVFLALMTTARSAAAGPFYPDRITVTMLGDPVVICNFCEDNDLLNDIRFEVVLEWGSHGVFLRTLPGGAPVGTPGALVISFNGSVWARSVGTTAPDFDDLIGGSLSFPVLVELWESDAPDYRSRTEGTLGGSLNPSTGLECCSGGIAGVLFGREFYSTMPIAASMINPISASYIGPLQPVPEPASLLLIGTGLAGFWGARRRRRSARPAGQAAE